MAPVEDEAMLGPVGWGDIHVDITDPVKVGELFGPDGEPLLEVYDRDSVPIGFQRP